jgi:hypothetical protein
MTRGWPIRLRLGQAGALLIVALVAAGLTPSAAFAESPSVTPVTVDPVTSPSVTAPSVSADSFTLTEAPEGAAGLSSTTKTANGPSGSTSSTTRTRSVPKAAKATAATADSADSVAPSLSSASMLSLLGLGGDSSLLKAIASSDGDTADSGEATGLDSLAALLGGNSNAAKSSNAVTLLREALAAAEKRAAQGETGGTGGSGGSGGTAATPPSASAAASSGTAKAASTVVTPQASGVELVRFTVDGYDVGSSCVSLVSSSFAKDGAFLMTGDRRYAYGVGTRNETFYLLCKPDRKNGWRLYADVSQPETNPRSFLYRLSRRTPLAGSRTGDLLVFRSEDAALRLNLVIRVYNPTVGR